MKAQSERSRSKPRKRRSSGNPSSSPVHPLGDEPLAFRQGSVEVKLYPTWNKSKKRDAAGKPTEHRIPQFTLSYYEGNKRVLRKFADLEKAKKQANLALVKIANGETEALKLTGRDRNIYVEANEKLTRAMSDLSLSDAITRLLEAEEQLKPFNVTLNDAIGEYVRRHKSMTQSRKISDLVKEFIDRKTKDGKSEDYLNSLRRLRRFAAVFEIEVKEINQDMLQRYFDEMEGGKGQPASPRTKVNYWRLVRSLLRYAVKKRYAPRDLLDELDGVELPDLPPSDITIWTPVELREMLDAARPELIPWLAIAAFAGLRTAEIRRLNWSDVNLTRRVVTVQARNAKTASRRVVPLCDAAIAWLKPHGKDHGQLAHYAEENKFCEAVIEDVNTARIEAAKETGEPPLPFKWRHNALRHSFCSYRLAQTENVDKTALEAGNSPRMIHKHYKQLVFSDEADRWFQTFPVDGENILNMRGVAA